MRRRRTLPSTRKKGPATALYSARTQPPSSLHARHSHSANRLCLIISDADTYARVQSTVAQSNTGLLVALRRRANPLNVGHSFYLYEADDRSETQSLHIPLMKFESLDFVHGIGRHVALAAVRADNDRDVVYDNHVFALAVRTRDVFRFRSILSADIAGHGVSPHSV